MLTRLHGVVRTASKLSTRAGVVAGAQALTVPLGASLALEIDLVRADGTSVALAGGTLDLVVKAHSDARTGVAIGFAAVATLLTPHLGLFTITPAQTAALRPQRYVYDVWWTDAQGSRWQVIELSAFILVPAAARPAA